MLKMPAQFTEQADWPKLKQCLIFAIPNEAVYADVVHQIEGLLDRAIASTADTRVAEAWDAAIAIAKQPINTLGWGSASGAVAQKVIVTELEAAKSQAIGEVG